jgi:hypothetical protein
LFLYALLRLVPGPDPSTLAYLAFLGSIFFGCFGLALFAVGFVSRSKTVLPPVVISLIGMAAWLEQGSVCSSIENDGSLWLGSCYTLVKMAAGALWAVGVGSVFLILRKRRKQRATL